MQRYDDEQRVERRNITIAESIAIILGSGFIVLGTSLGSQMVRDFQASRVPQIGEENLVVDTVTSDKKAFVKAKSEAIRGIVNFRLGGNGEQKLAAYQKIITDASKKMQNPDNEYEFYYYAAEGFLEQEKRYGTIDNPAKDYVGNFLGNHITLGAKKLKEINKSINETRGEKKETLIEGSKIIEGVSENYFVGPDIVNARADMLDFYLKVVEKGANKTEALAALLVLYNKILDKGAKIYNVVLGPKIECNSPSDEELNNYINKLEQDMLSFKAKQIASAVINQAKN